MHVYCTETKRASALLLVCLCGQCNWLKGWCPLKCLPDFVVLRGLCRYEGCSDRCCCYEIPEVKGQGSSNSGRLQCFVPEKSNVTGFPEPILAFYDSELMENYIICQSIFIIVIKAVFVFVCYSGKEENAEVLRKGYNLHTYTQACKQPKPKLFKKLLIKNQFP